MMINLTMLFITEDIPIKQVAFSGLADFHQCLFQITSQASREGVRLKAGNNLVTNDQASSHQDKISYFNNR